MQLRPRQVEFVDTCIERLKEYGNTLGIAPTGAGKTVMLSAVAKAMGGRTLIIQHRDELVAQNRATFLRVAPQVQTDLYTAARKRWSEGVTFSMIQTLCRPDNLDTMPAMDLVIIDEAHHVAAKSYSAVVEKAKLLNPNVKIFGVTATPHRGDKKVIIKTFNNVADLIELGELINTGFLVKPRFFVIDCDLEEALKQTKTSTADFDMEEAGKIMNSQVVNDRVIEEWRKNADGRKTVVFCSTVAHAKDVMHAFNEAGISANEVNGEMADGERKQIIEDFDKSKFLVMVNVAVLTEGWDCQDVSCVILLRPCSFKGTMIQMIGRGLRKVDPERYPGVVKSDCIVLDFGYSLRAHGSIEVDPRIKKEDQSTGEAPVKQCPECQVIVPLGSKVCPMCGASLAAAEAEKAEKEKLEDFVMTEINLLNMSPYKWQPMFDNTVQLANGITAWACIFQHGEIWFAFGKTEEGKTVRLIAAGRPDSKIAVMSSADDFLRQHGDRDACLKTKRWLQEPATPKQLQYLDMGGKMVFGMTKYLASCLMTWKFNEQRIFWGVTDFHKLNKNDPKTRK
jgi:superfamily II DNA or RNA helicase